MPKNMAEQAVLWAMNDGTRTALGSSGKVKAIRYYQGIASCKLKEAYDWCHENVFL